MTSKLFSSETELVAAFCETLPKHPAWTPYHETAGWDLLLVNSAGVQIGIEAKLGLNAKVLDQALPGRWASERGPDYRAVLVPRDGLQNHLQSLASAVGITVITVTKYSFGDWQSSPSLPDEKWSYSCEAWPNWCPAQRCPLPDYIPDVVGGKAAPVQLSDWKIRAIKLLILLERRGAVTRADMKALQISPSRWTDCYAGFLSPGADGYVRNKRTPDLRSQHPTIWPQIEADIAKWEPANLLTCSLPLESALPMEAVR